MILASTAEVDGFLERSDALDRRRRTPSSRGGVPSPPGWFAQQFRSWQAGRRDRPAAALVLEVKGDFRYVTGRERRVFLMSWSQGQLALSTRALHR